MDKLSYAFGVTVGQNLTTQFGIKDLNFEDFTEGLKTMFGKTEIKMSVDDINNTLNEHIKKFQDEKMKEQKKINENTLKEGKSFLSENAKKDGVQVTESGLQYKVLTKGTGTVSPTAHSRVRVHYEGKLTNGKVFDSSFERGTPVEFGLDQVIPGWTEGVQLMKEGDVFEFTIPSDLGYGPTGVPGHIPGNSVLIFKVELIKVL